MVWWDHGSLFLFECIWDTGSVLGKEIVSEAQLMNLNYLYDQYTHGG
jgi:hypothetical protein